jgi:hypothetical protein
LRSDMARVLCDEPRRGMRIKDRKGYKREQQRTPMEDQPRKSKGNLRRKWREHWNEGKEFGDHVEPLRRFVLSGVGRPWNDVYSEISKTIPKGTVVNDHAYTHLWGYVALNVRMVNGIPYDQVEGKYGRGKVYQDTYVHPESGLLCLTPKEPRRRSRAKQESNDWVGIDAYHVYYKYKGIWYLLTWKDLPQGKSASGYDVLFNEHWSFGDRYFQIRNTVCTRNNRYEVEYRFTKYYGSPKYCVSKRQIGKAQIRKILAGQKQV